MFHRCQHVPTRFVHLDDLGIIAWCLSPEFDHYTHRSASQYPITTSMKRDSELPQSDSLPGGFIMYEQ